MLFNFLKYLQPTHYFQLYRNDGTSIFPDVKELPQGIMEQLEPDENFRSKLAQEYDLSWQAIQKGYIGDVKTYSTFENLPLIDEYRFIRKYFSSFWVFYVLILRFFSFKNPFREITAWNKSGDVKKSHFLEPPITHEKWTSFESNLLSNKPLVSIVIPTLNRYEYLKDVLEDLEKQNYPNFEVIIVDQSSPFQ